MFVWTESSLMDVLEALDNSSRIDLSLWDSLRVGEAISMVSSTNWVCDKGGRIL